MGQSTAPLKCCTRCGTSKPLGEFYLVSGHRESRCKECENARRRNRDHVRYTGVSDITPEQELAMRRKARKCPMPGCGVRLTDKRGLPNSKHLDHIIPLGVGGTHTHGNCRVICRSCNLQRPKDGSDYSGPVTLWAQGEIQVSRHDRRHDGRQANKETCRKGLHPWTADNIGRAGGRRHCKACLRAAEARRRPLRPCVRCGTPSAMQGGQAMCLPCTDQAARRAAELHASGLSWNQVAPLVGYGSGEGARYAAQRIGYTAAPRLIADKRPRCLDCGQATDARGRQCQACVETKAWQAVEMRRTGMTLAQIARQLGFTSQTSVTNLMKTVVVIEPKMGRPM